MAPASPGSCVACVAALLEEPVDFTLGDTVTAALVGLAIRIAAKVTAYTCGLYVNRVLGRPQGRIEELWA